MTQNEVLIGGILVLADATLQQRRFSQRRETESQICASGGQALRRNLPLHRRWVDYSSAHVVGNLKSAPVVSRNAVEPVVPLKALERMFAVIAPYRKLRVGIAQVSGGGPEEKRFLAGRSNDWRQEWENFAQPRTAGKHIGICRQRFSRFQFDFSHPA